MGSWPDQPTSARVSHHVRVVLLRLAGAGVVLEVGCLVIWALAPQLTSDYSGDFNQRYLEHLGVTPHLLALLPLLADVDTRAVALQLALLTMSVGYIAGLLVLNATDLPISPARWLVAGTGLLAQATLATMPGFFSTDIFSYVMYGRIAAVHGDNPYVHPPSTFPNDQFLTWVYPFWREQTSVYGPLWTDLSWCLSSITGAISSLGQVLAYRAVLNCFELANVGLMWWLLGRLQPRSDERLRAFALFAWNPLVVFELAGNVHNDAAMLTLLLAGLGLIFLGRYWVGWIIIALGALIKFATGLPALLIATWWAAHHGRRYAFIALGLGLIVTGLLWRPWLEATDPLSTLSGIVEGRLVINSAPDLVALTVADQLAQRVDMDLETAQAAVRFWARLLIRFAFAIYFAWEIGRVSRKATLVEAIRASTRVLLALPLLVLTWVWSWYFTWSVALATLLGWRSSLTRLVVAYSLAVPFVVYAHQYWNELMPGQVLLVFAIGPPLALLFVAGLPARHRS